LAANGSGSLHGTATTTTVALDLPVVAWGAVVVGGGAGDALGAVSCEVVDFVVVFAVDEARARAAAVADVEPDDTRA